MVAEIEENLAGIGIVDNLGLEKSAEFQVADKLSLEVSLVDLIAYKIGNIDYIALVDLLAFEKTANFVENIGQEYIDFAYIDQAFAVQAFVVQEFAVQAFFVQAFAVQAFVDQGFAVQAFVD